MNPFHHTKYLLDMTQTKTKAEIMKISVDIGIVEQIIVNIVVNREIVHYVFKRCLLQMSQNASASGKE